MHRDALPPSPTFDTSRHGCGSTASGAGIARPAALAPFMLILPRQQTSQRSGQAEAETVGIVVNIPPKALSGAEVPGIVVPGAAASYPTTLFAALQPRRTVRWGTDIRVMPNILAPLPGVAVDIIETPQVWREAV